MSEPTLQNNALPDFDEDGLAFHKELMEDSNVEYEPEGAEHDVCLTHDFMGYVCVWVDGKPLYSDDMRCEDEVLIAALHALGVKARVRTAYGE